MNPVLKLLIEGGYLTTAQMAQVAGIPEAEINKHLEQLKSDKGVPRVAPGSGPFEGIRRRRPCRDRGQDHTGEGRGLQQAGPAPKPL